MSDLGQFLGPINRQGPFFPSSNLITFERGREVEREVICLTLISPCFLFWMVARISPLDSVVLPKQESSAG